MPFSHTHDIAIKGQPRKDDSSKNNWKNLGRILREDGTDQMFILFDAAFLSAEINYIYNPERKEQIALSLFVARDKNGNETLAVAPAPSAPRKRPNVSAAVEDNLSDDIPF